MIRVVIVEDEPVIAKGIQTMLEKYSLYHVSGTALNGIEGITLIKEIQPDIILSDIEMPQKNGIEMVQDLRNAGIKTEVIFLTAFRDFKYAQSAIQLGVTNYLVKPIAEAELLDALERTDIKLVSYSNTQKIIIRENLNRYLRTGELSSLRQVQDNQTSENWCIFYLLGADSRHHFSPTDYWQPLFKAFRKSIPFGEQTSYCFFLLEGFSNTDWNEECRQLKRLHPNWQIINSESFSKLTEIYGVLGRLQNKRRSTFFAGGLFLKDGTLSYRKAFHELEQLIEIQGNASLVIEQTYKTVNLIATNSQENISEFYQIFSDRMLRFLTLLKKKYPTEIAFSPEEILYHWLIQPNYNKLLETISYDLLNQILGTQPIQEGTLPSDVYTLMNYIQQNFRKDITLSELADLVNLNRTYVSSYFKRHTGESFKTYQTKLRVDEAKRLLRTTDKKIFAIADEIGYVGAHHFNSVFVQQTGLNPTQYRNQVKEASSDEDE